MDEENSSTVMGTFVVATSPQDMVKTKCQYASWLSGLRLYTKSAEEFYNETMFEEYEFCKSLLDEGEDEIDDPCELLTRLSENGICDCASYSPKRTGRDGKDETKTKNYVAFAWHMVAEASILAALSRKPLACVHSDLFGDAVIGLFNRDIDKLSVDPTLVVNMPVCFYLGNIKTMARTLHSDFCVAMLASASTDSESYQVVLLYGNSDEDINREFGCIHYVPFNRRSETNKYIADVGGVNDRVMINLYIDLLNKTLHGQGEYEEY